MKSRYTLGFESRQRDFSGNLLFLVLPMAFPGHPIKAFGYSSSSSKFTHVSAGKNCKIKILPQLRKGKQPPANSAIPALSNSIRHPFSVIQYMKSVEPRCTKVSTPQSMSPYPENTSTPNLSQARESAQIPFTNT